MASDSLFELQNLTLGYDGAPLLRNVHFRVSAEDSLVVVGPSGLGKSTLLKSMAGLLSPMEGRVSFRGQDLYALGENDRLQQMLQMGMLFQKNALFDSLTVFENVAFPLRERSELSKSEIHDRVMSFLEAVQIDHAKDLLPAEISGGMQKRLGIARALALNPAIIFYDDPTAGLDPITSRVIIDLILDLKSKNKSTVITITNDMKRAFQLAGRIFMVVDGEVIETGDEKATKQHGDGRVHQFIRGELDGPLMGGL